MLGVAGARHGALPPVAGGLLVLAGLMVGPETEVHSNAYFVAGAVVLLAAGIAVAAAVWRMGDEDYAGIGSSASAP